MIQIAAAAISPGNSDDLAIDKYGEMVDVNAWMYYGIALEKNILI